MTASSARPGVELPSVAKGRPRQLRLTAMAEHTLVGSAPEPSKDVLAELHATVAERAAIERRESVLVRRARNEGFVWEEIARALDITRQAVHKKYAAGLRRRA